MEWDWRERGVRGQFDKMGLEREGSEFSLMEFD